MPPRNLWELLINIKVTVAEQMVTVKVADRFLKIVQSHVLQLVDGDFISYRRFQTGGGRLQTPQ